MIIQQLFQVDYTLQSDGSPAVFKDVGAYNVTVSIGNHADLYTMTDTVYAQATIGKADLTVTAVANDIAYGDPVPAVTVTYEGLLGSDTPGDLDDTGFILGTDYTKGDVPGTYHTTIAMGTAQDDNYSFSPLVTTEFRVAPRAITVTADNKYKYVGENDPELTYSITAGELVHPNDLDITVARASGETAAAITLPLLQVPLIPITTLHSGTARSLFWCRTTRRRLRSRLPRAIRETSGLFRVTIRRRLRAPKRPWTARRWLR